MFNIFINDLDDGTGWSIIVPQTAWKECLIGLKDVATQRGLDWLQKWASSDLMKFNKGKGKALYLDKINPTRQEKLGFDQR